MVMVILYEEGILYSMSAHSVFYKKLISKSFFFYSFCLICVGLVAANIIYSQKYNQNMYGVMEGKTDSIITYLKHIWGTPLFNFEIESYRAGGRSDILFKWNDVQQENRKRIQRLEEAALSHSYSPELYYNLYLLYTENGDKTRAQVNLKKAQQIDPSIK